RGWTRLRQSGCRGKLESGSSGLIEDSPSTLLLIGLVFRLAPAQVGPMDCPALILESGDRGFVNFSAGFLNQEPAEFDKQVNQLLFHSCLGGTPEVHRTPWRCN